MLGTVMADWHFSALLLMLSQAKCQGNATNTPLILCSIVVLLVPSGFSLRRDSRLRPDPRSDRQNAVLSPSPVPTLLRDFASG